MIGESGSIPSSKQKGIPWLFFRKRSYSEVLGILLYFMIVGSPEYLARKDPWADPLGHLVLLCWVKIL